MNPRYPIYVISKGRWESRLTVRALESMHVPFRIAVEPQEYENYASVIDRSNIIKLPFSNLGQGSIPARNFIWEHSISEGHERHWVLDDNIRAIRRLNNNVKIKCLTGSPFLAAEDFVDRYDNVALAGFQYAMFAWRLDNYDPFILNTRIYSCILIRNGLKLRWRGRYNEDTDLSIRCLKDGWVTVLFYAFLAEKMQTMTMKGGNTDELYKDDGRLKMAESLREQHPDCVRVTNKWGRWQHYVDYSEFRRNNQLRLRDGVRVPDGVNNYGMVLNTNEQQIKKNGFAAQAEKYADKNRITPAQWTKLLNAGCYVGLTIEQINEKIAARYGAKTRELPASKFDDALEFLRGQCSDGVPETKKTVESPAVNRSAPAAALPEVPARTDPPNVAESPESASRPGDSRPAEIEDELITSKQWTKLLNVGLSSGKSFDAVTDLIKTKFDCRIRDLKQSQYDAAVELIR